MGMFLLSGAMGLQAMEKDVEAREKGNSLILNFSKIDCAIIAMRYGKSEEALQLVEAANEDPISDKIDRIIETMCYGKSEEALQLLEDIEDKDINRRGKIRAITLLGGAVLFNCVDVAQVLIERGADLHMECFDPDVEHCEARDQRYGNCTPFGMAIIDSNKEMIEFLVKHGADVDALISKATPLGNALDVDALILKSTPLQVILSQYFYLYYLMRGYFVSTNCNIRWLRLDCDYLQLDKAKYHGIYDDCLRQLSPGRNCLFLDNEGLKIINDCCSKNILKEMRFLIENGADVNARDEVGNTILHYLAGSFSYGGPFSFKFVDLLLEAGADPRIANNKGKFPLEKFNLFNYVAERFPERMKNYNELMAKFQQRIDELNVQDT
jgi:ankyrin repeat protein